MVADDLRKVYPELVKDVRIRVIELMDHVLSTYDRKLGEYTGKLFARNKIELVLNSRVTAVTEGCVTIADKAGGSLEVPFGACVWATGVAKNPLVEQIQARAHARAGTRGAIPRGRVASPSL